MSIAPPSDIVLDVAQAADPLKLQAATAKLAKLASGAPVGADDFAAQLATVRSSSSIGVTASPLAAPSMPDDRTTRINTKPVSVYQKFEAMVLQNFVESMLPKDTDLFGDGASADACRSMLADQLASQLSKSGKIGIAQMLERAHGPNARIHQASAGTLHDHAGPAAATLSPS